MYEVLKERVVIEYLLFPRPARPPRPPPPSQKNTQNTKPRAGPPQPQLTKTLDTTILLLLALTADQTPAHRYPAEYSKRSNPAMLLLRSFTLTGLASSARAPSAHFSSNIVRLGVDVLPPMSQAVIHNGIVYLSGQVDGTADDVTGQTKNVLAKVDKYLQEAGSDKSKLLTSTVWLKDIGRDFGAMNEVRISCHLIFVYSALITTYISSPSLLPNLRCGILGLTQTISPYELQRRHLWLRLNIW